MLVRHPNCKIMRPIMVMGFTCDLAYTLHSVTTFICPVPAHLQRQALDLLLFDKTHHTLSLSFANTNMRSTILALVFAVTTALARKCECNSEKTISKDGCTWDFDNDNCNYCRRDGEVDGNGMKNPECEHTLSFGKFVSRVSFLLWGGNGY